MEKIIKKQITKIQNYLANTPEPDHIIIDKYNGMHLTKFTNKFRHFNISYPYKDNKKKFLIELQEEDWVTICKMENNICISAYVFLNW